MVPLIPGVLYGLSYAINGGASARVNTMKPLCPTGEEISASLLAVADPMQSIVGDTYTDISLLFYCDMGTSGRYIG